jgi:steroid delta-isomerase
MKAVLQAYLDGLNAGNADAVLGLFADDGTVEDPVGLKVHSGRTAISAFYHHAVGRGAKFSLDAPIRASFCNAAAMAISVDVVIESQLRRVRIIEVMTFDDAGKIASMRAYFGNSDIEPQYERP